MKLFSFLIFLYYFVNIQAEYNGFNFFPFNSTALSMPDTLNSLKTIAELGSNWIGIDFILGQDSNISNEVYFEERTPTENVWSIFVQEAHKYNLSVLLKPLILCGDGSMFIDIKPSNITNWFSSYGQVIYNLSTMAQELRIEALAVGLELIQISNQEYTQYWRTLIENIRNGGYSGLLTYSSIFYPIETSHIGFWDALDFIGMDFYLPLLNITNDSSIPSYQDMINSFSGYFQYFKLWLSNQSSNVSSKPVIFTEVGYPSSLAGLAIPSSTPPAQCTGNYSANFTLQNMAFKALFQALDENSGIFNGSIIFWWDNPSSGDSYNGRVSNNWGCSWTVRDKPAECTIAEYFGGECSLDRNSSSIGHDAISVRLMLLICLILSTFI